MLHAARLLRLLALTRRVRPCRAALLDYFDFVSRVNAVVVTARALADVLLDPELHKFAAHLLALLHVRSPTAAVRTAATPALTRPGARSNAWAALEKCGRT